MADSNGNGNGTGNIGRIESVTGVVVDALFDDAAARDLLGARDQGPERGQPAGAWTSICEVQQHLGDDRVRAVAMDATDGLQRGDEVIDTGGPITVPVGKGTLGRIFNLLGEPIDNGGEVEYDDRWPIHRPAPERRGPRPVAGDPRDRDQGRRPARPVREGRQGRPVRRRRRRQDRPDPGADPQPRRGARGPVGLLRRRRALARGQRPLARDEGVGRHRQDDARLRPDERAARARACASPSPA